MRTLVVEADEPAARTVRLALEREGHLVSWARTGRAAIGMLRAWQPDLVLLAIHLPDRDGRDVARDIRAESVIPIIFVTDEAELSARVAGLDLGADDYVTKPFEMAELLARIRAVMRRSQERDSQSGHLVCRDLVMHIGEYRLLQSGKEIALTPIEFEILRMFLARPGMVVRRSEIATAIWNRTSASVGRTLDVHVSLLRQKLGDHQDSPTYIQTVRGIGFRLIAD